MSPTFRKLSEIPSTHASVCLILDIGNYMNDSNKQAVGFKLSSLARLGMVKDTNNESTLMDYVERVVRKQYPQYEGFADDIAGVLIAQKINIEQLQSDAKKYIDNINNVQASLDAGNLSDPKRFHPEDRVSQVVQRSMKEARRKAEQMQLYLDEMNRIYDDILTFFGDDNKDENARREFLWEGLRGDGEVSEVPSRDESGSLRIRRRRESADDERARRRARRRGAGTGSQDAGTQQSTIAEEGEGDSTVVESSAAQAEDVMSNGSQGDSEELAALPVPPTPTTVVVPPSPTGSVHGDDDADEKEEDGKDKGEEVEEEKKKEKEES
ncbi:hypothetical protein L7F22_007728 [Adiantum nelumboides]|nr:hypothetical protein [Adiantum nelumboides]